MKRGNGDCNRIVSTPASSEELIVGRNRSSILIEGNIPDLTLAEKWLRKSEQGDKWNRCLIEGMIVLSETGARDEQTTPP